MSRIEEIIGTTIQARALALLREGRIGHSWSELLTLACEGQHQLLHNAIRIASRHAQNEFSRCRNGWHVPPNFTKGKFKKAQLEIVVAIQREAPAPVKREG